MVELEIWEEVNIIPSSLLDEHTFTTNIIEELKRFVNESEVLALESTCRLLLCKDIPLVFKFF